MIWATLFIGFCILNLTSVREAPVYSTIDPLDVFVVVGTLGTLVAAVIGQVQ